MLQGLDDAAIGFSGGRFARPSFHSADAKKEELKAGIAAAAAREELKARAVAFAKAKNEAMRNAGVVFNPKGDAVDQAGRAAGSVVDKIKSAPPAMLALGVGIAAAVAYIGWRAYRALAK